MSYKVAAGLNVKYYNGECGRHGIMVDNQIIKSIINNLDRKMTEKWATIKDEYNHRACCGVNTKPWGSGQFTTLDIRNIKVEK